ncbi:MAG TPA: HD domain-containing protein [Candidatus Gemmiger excrementavium]|uniref:HD domain-containing protein n=1 Tax=Candidatus Gemmiger excrementavium TaxID=2838608 RepID=A0A9D2F3W0_9FIRM|nr:HD domain-containing protein [Candidatus Gemmiger excrementavium]
MTIPRRRALQAFAGYAAHYNADDPKVKLKIDHTYRVAALCARIAQSLALPGDDVDLAWLCGLLHDVGRFEQLRQYGTFNDARSIDHAAMSARVLFEEGRIRDYLDDDSADPLLRTAVLYHSAYRLPTDLDARTLTFCNILRDADKIDILRVNVETPMEQIYNVSTRELRQSPVSPAVLQAFYEHHCVLRDLKCYPADNAVGHASLVFELCYPESLRAVAEQGWLWKLLDFATDNPDTAAAFADIRAEMHRWLDQQMG